MICRLITVQRYIILPLKNKSFSLNRVKLFLSVYLLIFNILYYVFIVFYCYFLEHWESDG